MKTPALCSAAAYLTMMPGTEYEKKDSKALETLSPANRDAWFAGHISYCSVASLPDPDNIPSEMQHYHRKLGALKNGCNDSQLVFYDQVIPGSTNLGFFNADHWAMSVPIARQPEISQTLFADENELPQEIALKAISRFIEEDLGPGAAIPAIPKGIRPLAAAQLSDRAATILGGLRGKSLNRTPVD